MKTEMTHDQAHAELDALAFDVLDAPEKAAVLAHVEKCEACRKELDLRRSLVADLAFAAPLATDTPSGDRMRIRDRLMTRATADSQARRMATPPIVFPTPLAQPAVDPTRRAPARGWGRSEFFALAAGILFVATLGLWAASMQRGNDFERRLADQTVQTTWARHSADSLAALVAARDSLIAGLTGRDVTMMTLTSAGATEPYARMFWDRTKHSWTFIAHNMPELKTGRTYQLWLVTSKSKINAGTFETSNGEAVVMARLALSDPLAAVAVTEEPAGGVTQPTGSIVIAAAVPK